MVFRTLSLMISRALSKFSFVPPVEGRPERLQFSTEENFSKFCFLPMTFSPKAVMNISGVSNATFPRQNQIVMYTLCSFIRKSRVALNISKNENPFSKNGDDYACTFH